MKIFNSKYRGGGNGMRMLKQFRDSQRSRGGGGGAKSILPPSMQPCVHRQC